MNGTGEANSLGRIPAAAISAVHRGVTSGCEEAAHVLRQIGLEAAPAVQGAFTDWLRRSGEAREPGSLGPAEFWRALREFFLEIGLGPMEQDELHPGVVSLSSTGWIEATAADQDHVGCHLTTGLLAGLLRGVSGEDLAVLEVECRGSGEDQCRFLAGSAAALEQVFGEIERGTAYADAVSALG